MRLSLIVATTENNVIGRDGGMPWHLPADLKWFKQKTLGHCLIMGRRTYESFGRPLPRRTSIVLCRNAADLSIPEPTNEETVVLHASSLEEALQLAPTPGANQDEVFIGGGGGVYREALPHVDRIYLTRIHTEIQGDATFPDVDWGEWKQVEATPREADEKNKFDMTFEVWDRL